MVQRVFSIFMTFLFLLIVTQRAWIIVHFKLNQEVIAQKLCINKDSPERNCQGLCFLKKELKKTENKDVDTVSTYRDFELISIPSFEFEIENKQMKIRLETIHYTVLFPSNPSVEVVKPPPRII